MNNAPISTLETMIARWDEKCITHVTIIDDAFDPPRIADYSPEQCEEFVAAVLSDDAAQEEATQLGCYIAGMENLDETLQILWEHREELFALQKHCSPLFRLVHDKREQLAPLQRSLEELNRTVDCIGVEGTVADTSTRLVFIDYHLGPGYDSVTTAKQVASSIIARYDEQDVKPLIILMSSQIVTPEMINEFRQGTGLIPGMFYFLPKDDFEDKDKLLYKLDHFATAVPDAAKIQKLLDYLETALKYVSADFIQNIKELSFGDYAYIQTLSLQDDGHPLGDYMLWLFNSYLGHLLAQDEHVRKHRKQLDQMTFRELPSGQTKPSLWLATIYRSALASEEDNDLIHPRTPNDVEQGLPYLTLGDLFVKDAGSPFWMVVNAQCDLAFTPDSQQRRPKIDRSVFMIPGKIQPISDPLSIYDANKTRTELFEWKGTAYRILWDTKRVKSWELGDVLNWRDKEGYSRVARLRLPFALAVQQAFGQDMTRMGMPVAPPIYRPVRVQLLCCGGDGKAILLDESDDCAAFLTRDKEKYVEKCRLNENLLYAIPGKIGSALSLLRERLVILQGYKAGNDSITKIQNHINHLHPFLNAAQVFLALRSPFSIPFSGENDQLSSYPFCIRRNDQPLGKAYRFDQPLAFNILDVIEQGTTNE